MGVIFLDQDDEITTAISRLRASEDIKVALVLPPGSRLGTSRINFRLLAREAQDLPRQASIVTSEAGVRAIAVSAGLLAYATVAEYEAAIAQGPTAGSAQGDAAAADVAATTEGAGAEGPAIKPTVEAAAIVVAATEASPTSAAAPDAAMPTDDDAAGGLAPAAVVGAGAVAATKRSRSRKAKDPSTIAAPVERGRGGATRRGRGRRGHRRHGGCRHRGRPGGHRAGRAVRRDGDRAGHGARAGRGR